MATLLYTAAMSLDGFIAGPAGDMAWLTPYFGPNPLMDELLPDIGALLVGGRTFHGDDPNRDTDKEGAFGGAWSGPQFVLTHHPPADPVPGVTFTDDVRTAVTAASTAAGDGYVCVLGAATARSCLEAGLLDEVLVVVAPVLLGDGTRLFDHPGGRTVRLDRLRLESAEQSTCLWFRVRY
ncbi:dihydrofolate reductase [Pseudonocardiaceae bacterium YIM PH 21723]|nr:dihydrofolate reductase [Pseudonocardiaceae bacterium YIM PH 21723]